MSSDAINAQYPPIGGFLEVQGARIHYTRQGQGPALVLIHGANGNVRDWHFSHVAELASDFEVITFDRPGLGYSDRIPRAHSPFIQAAHLHHALTQLDIGQATLAGHSYGGAIALAWALQFPRTVAGLLLLAAPSHPWPGHGVGLRYALTDHWLIGAFAGRLYRQLASKRIIEETFKSIFAPDHPPEGYTDYVGAELATRYETVRANAADVNRLKPFMSEMAAGYSNLTMPIELIHGEADTIVPLHIHSEPFIASVPHARLTRLPNAGHMPHHTHKAQMHAALDRLMQDYRGAV